MAANNVGRDLLLAGEYYPVPDPGASGTIQIGTNGAGYCGLRSAAAETRTLPRPTTRGASLFLAMETRSVGDITLTVTGGYNENGDTTFTFSDPGQFLYLESMYESVANVYEWRKIADHNTANSTFSLSTPATPASVATTPGTAASASLSGTGAAGGNTSIATTGVGGVGGGTSYTSGAGGIATAAATSGTGGKGGNIAWTTGAGGAQSIAGTTEIGGAGGDFTVAGGTGGAVLAVAVTTATGGAGGAFTVTGGTGGQVTATGGTNTGGAGGAVTLTGGTGGAASAATDTGGAGGDVTITSGTGGAGDTGGRGGNIVLATGAVGAGGSPAAGIIKFSPAGTERWGFYGTTNCVLTTFGAVPSNITGANGVILPAGGIAITDVANAWIDDSTHGSGTVAHLIGNQTITTASDVRIKKNVRPFEMACAAVKRAPRTVAFEYDHPNWGGDRAAPGDEDARKWGPNARGTYVGFLAQETKEVYPWVVNAGAGEHCPKCKAGLPCEDETHPFWHVEYQHLVPMLTAALKEMILRVEKLESRLGA